jgi:hypothetical protein
LSAAETVGVGGKRMRSSMNSPIPVVSGMTTNPCSQNKCTIRVYRDMRGSCMTARSSDMRKPATPALLIVLLGIACISPQPRPALTEPPRLVFQNIQYDGRTLSGLLFVEARSPTVMDRRLAEDVSVGLASVLDSETRESLSPWVADRAMPEASGDDLITLRPGEWFGRNVSFLVFADPGGTAVGPRCIDFELFLILPEAGVRGTAATVPAQACQPPPKPPTPISPEPPQRQETPDAGRPAPELPPTQRTPDAGVAVGRRLALAGQQ